MKARCISVDPLPDDSSPNHITLGKEYLVVTIEYGELRIVDDRGEPIMYRPERFKITDPTPGSDWVIKKDEDGGVCQGPRWLLGTRFIEDFFDWDPKAREEFSKYVNAQDQANGND